jgi:hypothetical protein
VLLQYYSVTVVHGGGGDGDGNGDGNGNDGREASSGLPFDFAIYSVTTV